jgi:multiple sugar transport system permease protein
MKQRQGLAAVGFLAPNLAGFALFTLGPVLVAAGLSFYKYQLASGVSPEFTGLENFTRLIGFHHTPETGLEANDPYFWQYLGNTMFLMLNIPLSMIGALILAVQLNKPLKGRIAFRTLFFIPHLCSGVAIFMVWKMLLTYEPNVGIINGFLWNLYSLLGIPPERAIELLPGWLIDRNWAKPAIIIMFVWGAVGGFNMILYLAGLQNIPLELYEAAEMDGAGWWPVLRNITIPMLAPTTFFIFVTSVIGGLQGGFEAAYVMTQGGPEGSTTPVSYYIFTTAYERLDIGYAAAISMVLFALIFSVTLINWRFGGKKLEAS